MAAGVARLKAMWRWLYSGLMLAAQPLLKRKLRRRSLQEPGYGHAVPERFGHYTQPVPPHDGPTVWVHAVSLGETRAAAALVAALRTRLPHMRLLLTHGTATGRAEGLKCLQPGDMQAWQPWDTQGAVQRFLAHFKPNLGVLMETEVWPNLSHACQKQGVPLVLVNARLSDKSLRQAQRLGWLAKPAFAALTAVWAQTPQDAQRLASLGAKVQGVLGNLKFDAPPNQAQLVLGQSWRNAWPRPVVMLASSREGEELALLQFLKENWPLAYVDIASNATENIAMNDLSAVQWLLVPRHPQRFDDVAQLIQSHGFGLSRRSEWDQSGPPTMAQPTIWLGDTLGEMATYYGLARVALLGGSFEPLGGQNLIEAAACACPVVMGPHTFNFAQASEMALAAGAAQRVNNLLDAMGVASQLATDRKRCEQMADGGVRFFELNRGAVAHTADAVVGLLGQ